MQWGTPKQPDCDGFLIAQFQQLDLSRMDFREVYAEFVDAAKLPSEIEMSIQIQQKIESYYTRHGGTGS
jgi:conjugal transfer mating pair stabilization protein TraN